MDQEAAAWKTRYELVVGLVEPKHVEAAEAAVKAAIELSNTTNISFQEAMEALVYTVHKFKD